MRIEQLEYVVAIAELHSMQKTSEVVHTSVQNLSKNIKQLETELDTILFTRSSAGLYLTLEGKEFYEEAKQILAHVNHIYQRFGVRASINNDEKQINAINILSANAESALFSDIYMKLIRIYKLSASEFYIQDACVVNSMLKETLSDREKYDIIITNIANAELSNFSHILPGYTCYFLVEDRIGIRVSQNHPLAKEKSVSFKQLNNIPLIEPKSDIVGDSQIKQIVQSAGFLVEPKFRVNAGKQCLVFLINGFGYVFTNMSEFDASIQRDWPGTVTIPLNEKLLLNHILFIRDNILSTSLGKDLLNFTKKIFPNMHKV